MIGRKLTRSGNPRRATKKNPVLGREFETLMAEANLDEERQNYRTPNRKNRTEYQRREKACRLAGSSTAMFGCAGS